ncbi:Uncharacterized protein ALO80_00807 [Pseudomonas caricapapayae]|uniref:Uncharacterized protein n=1 Tax=Pseudomonas caricapapayae TaxID=46678 RepID=A0A0P9PDI0_9PSED|nr:hypothetical protein [Pseudomonas caricapapayae]KAA8693091.1 hypothetical protein F4W67_22095 [Pseudomonas caricapapayae]KPW54939.1 Uncharacterized protein ALO80_00807 [Pseudomonas caricapapayae]RMM12110.1 hypothetical protein ALQ84_02711 [Pseudomonas caricapapayae]RMV97159.1 hypothetical protein ALP01_200422 [Pseudomonas caricapapayae]
MLSDADSRLSAVIFELIKKATNQQVVRDFLQEKGVATSGNWEVLYEKRILPALQQSIFTITDLRELLQTVEEYGRQHTFLYQCEADRAQSLINPARVRTIAREENLEALLDTPLDINFPDTPTIVDIRIFHPDPALIPVSLTIKIIEKRITKVFDSEQIDREAGTITKKYNFTEKRAVNIATLNHEGLLELRIASQDNSTKYTNLVRDMFMRIRKFIPIDGFGAISLGAAKDKILKDRVPLAQEFRYSNSTAVNNLGAVLQLSSSSQDDNLSSDNGSMAAIDSFLAGDGHVTGANVYAKIQGTNPQREIHLLLGGDVNEFAVPGACSAGDYSYVRGKVISLNT